MVSIIKNQLLKHLSRYTKNLSADKINLNTLKGEGELFNLQLDEDVLTELLELPTWCRLSSAYCNHVSIKISWTKLKSVPIVLTLDSVDLVLETCELSRLSPTNMRNSSQNLGKYSFIHKVIDGITVIISTINIKFLSPAFAASFQMSRIRVESRTPKWQLGDLRFTRLKDFANGQVLVFKEISWQTMRIEASSTKDENLTPLRLLTNQAKCRITIKKKMADCMIVSSRLVVILDDLLWVLTDSQLKAALHFIDSLIQSIGLIQSATQQTQKIKAQRKLETLSKYCTQVTPSDKHVQEESLQKPFAAVDPRETSYHFCSQRIDLHLCDDPGNGRSVHPHLKDGGALQISIVDFQIDFYPYHLATATRTHWPKYKEASIPPAMWLDKSISAFKDSLLNTNQFNIKSTEETMAKVQRSTEKSEGSNNQSLLLRKHNLSQLMTTCVILRIQEFTLYRVTTSGKKQRPKPLIVADKDRFSFPDEISTIHGEFTYFYYPGDFVFTVPDSKLFIHINPVQMYFDLDSCLWLNSFMMNLHESLLFTRSEKTTDIFENNKSHYFDLKIEAIMPRIVFEGQEVSVQKNRPKLMHIQISRFLLTNIRETGTSIDDLQLALTTFQEGSFTLGKILSFQNADFKILTDSLLSQVASNDITCTTTSAKCQSLENSLWTIKLDPVWIEFYGAHSIGSNRGITFIDAVPITLWVHLNTLPKDEAMIKQSETLHTEEILDLNMIVHISNLVSVQIDHYQLLFLLRLADVLTELTAFTTLDSKRIMQNMSSENSFTISTVIPQLELSLIMPSQATGLELSGGNSQIRDSTSPLFNGSGQHHSLEPLNDNTLFSSDGSTSGVEVVLQPIPNTQSQNIQTPTMRTSQKELTIQHETASFNICDKNATDIKETRKDNNSGLSSMKMGLATFMSSLDLTLKSSIENDTFSIHSDNSSDSDNFLVLMGDDKAVDCVDVMFKLNTSETEQIKIAAVEEASEVFDDGESPSEPSDQSFFKRCDLIATVTIKLSALEILKKNRSKRSSTCVQISTIVCEECNAIPWDEFQVKFGGRSRLWCHRAHDASVAPCVTLRIDEELNIPRDLDFTQISTDSCILWFTRHLSVKIQNINLTFSMSSIAGLMDLVEDEITTTPIPMEVELENIILHLIEDRSSRNLDSSGAAPVDLEIEKLYIMRDLKGVFQLVSCQRNHSEVKVGAASSCTSTLENERQQELLSTQIATQKLKTENEKLVSQLAILNKAMEVHKYKAFEEINLLKSLLSASQNDVKLLLQEKNTLMETVKNMQGNFKQQLPRTDGR